MEVENIDFMDAIRLLAQEAGIDLSRYENIRYDKKQEEHKERQKRLQAVARDFFVSQLVDSEQAMSYVRDVRGLSDSIISQFAL